MKPGTVVVIASPGQAYDLMQEAWLVSWRRQHRPGLRLVILRGGPAAGGGLVVSPLDAPAAQEVRVAGVPETLVPGVLDKTMACLAELGPGWVFRTNLSSYVEVAALQQEMEALPEGGALGYSPGRDHLCGAGLGLSPGAVSTLLRERGQLDRSLIDDVAISRLLFSRGCPVTWTGRIDRVWPDGLCLHGTARYHVRVKTLDRMGDALLLMRLAEEGVEVALAWFAGLFPGL